MILLLDIGNTRDKAALYNSGTITLLTELTPETVRNQPLTAVYYACVAQETRLEALKQSLALHHLNWHRVVAEGQAFSVTNSYVVPELLGVDRWLALLAAAKLYSGIATMIVDAGTALTIDWLDTHGVHQGGWIMPGLRLQQQSVVAQTAKVTNKDPQQLAIVPGKETAICLQNGCLASVTGAIRQGWLLNTAQRLILTGGDAEYLKLHLTDLPVTIEPLLIFHGLARYISD